MVGETMSNPVPISPSNTLHTAGLKSYLTITSTSASQSSLTGTTYATCNFWPELTTLSNGLELKTERQKVPTEKVTINSVFSCDEQLKM